MLVTTLVTILSTLAPLTSARTWDPEDECPTKIHAYLASEDRCQFGATDLYCSYGRPKFTNMDCIHAALSTCPDVTALDLRLSTSGCTSEAPDRWDFPFDPKGGDKYADVKTLRLEGYDFSGQRKLKSAFEVPRQGIEIDQWLKDTSRWVKSGLIDAKQRFLSANPPAKTHLDLWMQAMNWSAIEELMIEPINDEHMAKLPSRLHSLRRLETTNSSFIYALPNNTLTHLTYIEHGKTEYSAKDLPTILEYQGQSLQSLEVRSPEIHNRPFLPNFDVHLLPTMTPNLAHVTMNVARNGTWPFDTLDVLASLPRLSSADLYMGIQSICAQQRPAHETLHREERKRVWEGDYCRGADQYQRPFVSKEGAEEVFAYLRREKQGVDFTNMTFYVGDWSRPWNGPLYFPDWMEGKRAKVVCSVENGEGKCVVERAEKYWEWSERDWSWEEDREWDLWEELEDLETKRWEERNPDRASQNPESLTSVKK
jgi:hypothetical protein